MKKIIKILGIFLGLFLPQLSAAQTWYVPPIKIPQVSRFADLGALVGEIINILLLLVGLVALIYLIFSGYKYISAGGNPEQAAQAKSGIIAALLGLIIAFIAWALVDFIFYRLSGVIPEPNANRNTVPESVRR